MLKVCQGIFHRILKLFDTPSYIINGIAAGCTSQVNRQEIKKCKGMVAHNRMMFSRSIVDILQFSEISEEGKMSWTSWTLMFLIQEPVFCYEVRKVY
jgi:hypothetical protein